MARDFNNLRCNVFVGSDGTGCLVDESMLQLLLLQGRGFDDVVNDRGEDVADGQLLLKLGSVGQHRRRKDGRVRSDGRRIGWIGRAGHDKTNVVAGSSKDRSNALAADALKPVLVDLSGKKIKRILVEVPK